MTLTFKGDQDVLSNFFCFIFYFNHVRFLSSEHCYQYCKALFHNDKQLSKVIRRAPTPAEAKRISRQIRTTPAWHDSKVTIMEDIARAKYLALKSVRDLLQDNPQAIIAEAVSGDLFWGTGLGKISTAATPPAQWPGANMMGRIWMKVRDSHPVSDVPRRPHLLICDSIGRPLQGMLMTVDVQSFPGARIEHVTKMITDNPNLVIGYDTVIIHVGTNNIESCSVIEISKKMMGLYNLVKSVHSNKTFVSCILPRLRDFALTKNKVKAINKMWEHQYGALCFRCHRRFLQSGNESVFFRDGLHLNGDGAKLFASKLRCLISHSNILLKKYLDQK